MRSKTGSLIPHPPLRVGTFLIIIITGVLVRHLEILSLFLFFGGILLHLEGVPFSTLLTRLKVIFPILLFLLLFFPFYEKSLTEGLAKGALYSGRLLFVTLILTLLFHHLPLPRFLHALKALHLPPLFIQLLFFTLRFMEVFAHEAKEMMIGMKSRGYRGKRWFSVNAYRTLSRLPGSLLVRAFARSERITLGLLSRGYSGQWVGGYFPKMQGAERSRAALLLLISVTLLIADSYALLPTFSTIIFLHP